MPRKFDKNWKALPGYDVGTERQRQLDEAYQRQCERHHVKTAQKKLVAQGFVFDNLMQRIRNLTAR